MYETCSTALWPLCLACLLLLPACQGAPHQHDLASGDVGGLADLPSEQADAHTDANADPDMRDTAEMQDLSPEADLAPGDLPGQPVDLPAEELTSPEDLPGDSALPPEDSQEEIAEADTAADLAEAPQAPPGYDRNRCQEVEAFGPQYSPALQRWARQDDAAPPAPGGLVLVGSSSVRRWEGFAQTFEAYHPIQRGFGGGQLGEVALMAQDLITRHDPALILVFAGTNDVSAQVDPQVVLERLACLRQRVGQALGWDRPLGFVGITPTPARWDQWEQAQRVNEGARAMAQQDPGLFYVDSPALFLRSGSPPALELFVEDRLHLSEQGYQLWAQALLGAAQEQLGDPPSAPTSRPPWAPGTRVLLDLGPSDGVNGEPSLAPDYLGQHWNNWHALEGGQGTLAGEHLDELLDTQGGATGLSVVVTGGFLCNGWNQGGLRWPQREALGELAVGSATGDFFYTTPQDSTGGLWLRGLHPEQRYTLRLFASREHSQRRVTGYRVHGQGDWSAQLQTSGPGAAPDSQGNQSQVAELTDLRPTAQGSLFLDVQLIEGDYAYLSLLELIAQ